VAGRTFITTTRGGVARAAENGGAWTVERLLSEEDVRCLAADPLDEHVVYAGTQGNGVLRSDDGGRSWRPAGLAGKIVKSLAASRLEPGAVYAGTKPPCVFVSHDGGETWAELDAFRRIRGRRAWFSPAEKPGTAYVQALALSPSDPRTIVAGIEFGAVVRSEDGGETWSGHRPGALRDCHSLTFHASDGSWVYEAGNGGGAHSRDAGRSWSHTKEGLDRTYGWAIAADPERPDIRYVSVSPSPFKAHGTGGADAAIFRAEGDGPWEKLGGGLPDPLDGMPYALVTDPEAPGHLYAGLATGEVWRSGDYGEAWERLPLALGRVRQSMLML
jgi:photosystem II stability/assembly factor-like uncharacterized protein